MIADFPTMLLVLLAVLTVLGAIIGYCVALIRVKRLARKVIDETRLELNREKSAAQSDLLAARNKIDTLRASAQQLPVAKKSVMDREKVLQQHSQRQAKRIKTLQAQLTSLEAQQAKVQQDFANYKINKASELELAREASASLSENEMLPTLSRRVSPPSALHANAGDLLPPLERSTVELSWRKHDELSNLLTPELDIPSLAESELSDSVDELEFDLTGAGGGGAGSRG